MVSRVSLMQISFGDGNDLGGSADVRREVLPAEMDQAVPWEVLLVLICNLTEAVGCAVNADDQHMRSTRVRAATEVLAARAAGDGLGSVVRCRRKESHWLGEDVAGRNQQRLATPTEKAA